MEIHPSPCFDIFEMQCKWLLWYYVTHFLVTLCIGLIFNFIGQIRLSHTTIVKKSRNRTNRYARGQNNLRTLLAPGTKNYELHIKDTEYVTIKICFPLKTDLRKW